MSSLKIKAAIGRWIAKRNSLRLLAQAFLRVRTLLRRRRQPLTAILSMGVNGHAYSAARAVKALGHRVLLITNTPQLPEMAYADALLKRDPLVEIDKILIELETFQLDAVMVSTDHILLPAQDRIARRFGLVSVGAETAELNNDKFAWRNALAANGIRQPSFSQDPNFFTGQTCIRKPRYGRGSAEVIALKPKDDKISHSGPEYFFESVLHGDQYDLEGVVKNYKIYFYGYVFEQYIYHCNTFVSHYYMFNFPISSHFLSALQDCATKTLTASKVQIGAFHVEMRMNGTHAEPIDFANRISGYERCMSFSSGVDLATAHASGFLSKKHQVHVGRKRPMVQFFCWTEEDYREACAIRDANPEWVFDANMKQHEICGERCYGMISFFHNDHTELLRMVEGLKLRIPEGLSWNIAIEA